MINNARKWTSHPHYSAIMTRSILRPNPRSLKTWDPCLSVHVHTRNNWRITERILWHVILGNFSEICQYIQVMVKIGKVIKYLSQRKVFQTKVIERNEAHILFQINFLPTFLMVFQIIKINFMLCYNSKTNALILIKFYIWSPCTNLSNRLKFLKAVEL
jgi:hypothetical protein